VANVFKIALGTIVGGVVIGALVAWAMPSTTTPATSTSWTQGVGNRDAGSALKPEDQTTIDYGSNPPLTPPPRYTGAPETAYMPSEPDDRDRDAADDPPPQDDDAAAPVDDRAAQAADEARDAADDARAAEDAPPDPARGRDRH
jgi:hypothetical protein